MIQSMTGYAAISRDIPGGSVSVELRSINSRFLDLSFRLPDDLRSIEPALRELIVGTFARGKVECRVHYQLASGVAAPSRIHPEALSRLAQLAAEVNAHVPQARPLSVAEILDWPGVIADRGEFFEQARQAALVLMPAAAAELVAARTREGGKLATLIHERTAQIRQGLRVLEPSLPLMIAQWQERITTRLRDAVAGLDEDRIRQEVALFGIKVDIAEEIGRLGTHLDEVDRLCADRPGATPPVGKRLDFLMQELNREANTLGSKSVSREMSDAAIDFKVLIEQMREQVQNLE